jgi:hypothetical protein
MACEDEWKWHEAVNDAVQWGVTDATKGWEVTPPASPVGGVDVAGAGTWSSHDELVNARVAAWPGFPPDYVKIEVTIEKHSSVGGLVGEYSTCRSPYDIVCCFGSLTCFSHLCHRAVGTSL